MKASLLWLFTWLTLALPTSLLAQQPAISQSPPEALNIYADAASLQNNGEFALAAEDWEKFLKRFPSDPLAKKARHYAGVCYLQTKAYDKAAAHFDAVLKQDPKFELAEDALLNLGWCRYSLGNKESYAQAAEAFVNLLKQFPNSKYADQSLFYLGESLYAQGNKPQAIGAYRKLVADHPASPLRCNVLYALGVTYEEVQEYTEAGRTYDLFLKECGESELATEVRMRKAETVLQLGDPAKAETMFAEVAAVEDFASADHALSRQAFCAARQDKFAEAGKLYALLVGKFPQSSYADDARMSAGRSFYRAEDFDQAGRWFQQAMDASQANAAEAAHWLCRIRLKEGQPSQALQLAGDVLAKAPEGPYVVNLMMDQADALYELPDERDASMAKYAEIAEKHPDHELAPQALYNAAFAALQLQDYQAGLQYADAFIAKYPKDRFRPDVNYVTADCHLKRNELAESETAYRQLLRDYKNHSEYDTWRVRLGLALYMQKKYAEAIAALEETVADLKQPAQQAEAHFLLGASHFQQDQFEPAAASLSASLAADPAWRQADETLLYLSRAQRGLNKLDEAKTTVTKLIREQPESSLLDQAYFRLGEYSYAANDFAAAVAAYDAMLDKWPDSPFAPYAWYGQGWSQMKAKQFPRAIESFSSLIDNFDDHRLAPETYLARGMARRQAGELESAIADYDAYLKSSPGQPQRSDALYERGLAEVAASKLPQAASTFETLLQENPKYANTANVLYELAWAHMNQKQPQQAIAAFAKLAGEHPGSELAAEANLHVAESLYDKEQYKDAVPFYLAAIDKAKPGQTAERARHKLGWARYRQDEFKIALDQFDEQLKAYADGELAADAHFMKAECLFKLERYSDAITAFEETLQRPSSDAQKQVLALLHGGQSAAQLGEWQQSLKLLDQITAKFPDTPYLAEAIYESGWAKQNLNQLAEALKDYTLASEKSRGPVGARAQFMMGEVYFQQKKFDDAIRRFKRVMYGYGDENAPESIKPWQALAAYEAGRCAEVQIQSEQDAARRAKLIEDAKASFTYVLQRHPEHEKADQARERIAALAQL